MKYSPKELIDWMVENKMIPSMMNAIVNNDVGFNHLCVKPILIKNGDVCYTVIETTGDTIELPDISINDYLTIMNNIDKTLECIIHYKGESIIKLRTFSVTIDNDNPESVHLVMKAVCEYFLELTGMDTHGKVKKFIERCQVDYRKEMYMNQSFV